MTDDYFERDETHPISNVEVCDLSYALRTGGSTRYLMVARPLESDRRSLERLMRKLQGYLACLRCEECLAKYGAPSPENTTIVVKLHPESSDVAFDLLERNAAWVRNNDATLVIDTSPIDEFDGNPLYQRDDAHPIPNLDVVDINAVKRSGGADLVINIASPLEDDRRSLERLLEKIERYLAFLASDEFVAEGGMATVENTRIIVNLHPASSEAAFGLLEDRKAWVLAHGARLEIDAAGIAPSLH